MKRDQKAIVDHDVLPVRPKMVSFLASRPHMDDATLGCNCVEHLLRERSYLSFNSSSFAPGRFLKMTAVPVAKLHVSRELAYAAAHRRVESKVAHLTELATFAMMDLFPIAARDAMLLQCSSSRICLKQSMSTESSVE